MTDADDSTLAYTRLQPDDILETLDELGFDCNGRFLALNSYENRVYKIGIGDNDNVVVKFYRPGRWSDAAILEEHSFADELVAQEIPLVPPMSIDGQTLFHTGLFRLAVYPCRGGRAPELDDWDQLQQLGRLVARIHLVGETSDFEDRPQIDVDSYGIASRDFLLDEDFIPEEMRDAYAGIADLVIDGIERSGERSGCDCTQIFIPAMCSWRPKTFILSIWMMRAAGRPCRIYGCSCPAIARSRHRSLRRYCGVMRSFAASMPANFTSWRRCVACESCTTPHGSPGDGRILHSSRRFRGSTPAVTGTSTFSHCANRSR